jgi:DNA-binding transcriptional LysR family regulator
VVLQRRSHAAPAPELLSELDDLQPPGPRRVAPGLPLLGGDALFAGLFAEYRRRYPNISIQLLEGGSRNIEQAMLSGELELGGSLRPRTRHSPGSLLR